MPFWRIGMTPRAVWKDTGQLYQGVTMRAVHTQLNYFVDVQLPTGVLSLPITDGQYRVLCHEIIQGLRKGSIEEPARPLRSVVVSDEDGPLTPRLPITIAREK